MKHLFTKSSEIHLEKRNQTEMLKYIDGGNTIIDHENRKSKLKIIQNGGGNIKYKQKYLKYKQKYLNLLVSN